MTNFTPEMIEKAKTAASPEELLDLAKANGVELSADQAAAFFAQLSPKQGELNDDELDCVAGGGCGSKSTPVSNYVYDVFAKWPYVTHVLYDDRYCPNCYDRFEKRFVHEFNLKWVDESHISFYLICTCCGYEWRAGSFRGDPRKFGVTPNPAYN